MSDLLTRIIEVQLSHIPIDYAGGIECACGTECKPQHGGIDVAEQMWADHVADAVIRELGLQPETLCHPGGAILTRLDGKVLADNRYMTRWATNWEPGERPVK